MILSGEAFSTSGKGTPTVPHATVIHRTVSSRHFSGQCEAHPEREPSCLQAKVWLFPKHHGESHWHQMEMFEAPSAILIQESSGDVQASFNENEQYWLEAN